MEFKQWLEYETPEKLTILIADLKGKFPGLDLYVFETSHKVEISVIELPKDMRNQGVGSIVMKAIQEYAQSVGKPIVLSPDAERGKKAALERFYKNHGFVYNKGRNKDFTISSTFAKTMYWRPD